MASRKSPPVMSSQQGLPRRQHANLEPSTSRRRVLLETSGSQDRFSFVPEPFLAQHSQLHHSTESPASPSSPTNSDIDESPTSSPAPTQTSPPAIPRAAYASEYVAQRDLKNASQAWPDAASHLALHQPPDASQHPAHFAPFADDITAAPLRQQSLRGPAHPRPSRPQAPLQAQSAPLVQQHLASYALTPSRAASPSPHANTVDTTTLSPPMAKDTALSCPAPNDFARTTSPPPALISMNSVDEKAPAQPPSQHHLEPPQLPVLAASMDSRPPPIYSPDSLGMPNAAAPSAHRPGHVSPASSRPDPQWRTSLCTPDTACLSGIFCPCLLYGRVQYRLAQHAAHRDPTDILGHKTVNGACGLFALALTLPCLAAASLAALQRRRVRRAFHLDGSCASDCLLACCCFDCVLAQNEREIRRRADSRLHHRQTNSIQAASGGYIPPTAMVYPPPPRTAR